MLVRTSRLFPRGGEMELRHDFGEAPETPVTAGHVRVKIESCSFNFRDLLVRSGKSASGGSDPVIPLSDGAGEIVSVGECVATGLVGKRVCLTFFEDWFDGPFDMRYHQAARGGSIDGVLSRFVEVPAESIVPFPDHLSFDEAACLPCAYLTAWQALFERGSQAETILCLGTGGVSIAALQLAKARGATVIMTSSSDVKLERAEELGADYLINYQKDEDWQKTVFEITEKRGVDQVIEVGGPGTLEKSLAALAPGGTLSMIGVLTGFDPPETSLFPVVAKALNVHGIYVGSRAMFGRMNEFIAEHQIQPVVDKTFAHSDTDAAYEDLKEATHFGKVVISLDESV
ncbi:MAG: NAD(P)-dependent alcohol dehydrogenase [Verrucomicrobiota bacterium]